MSILEDRERMFASDPAGMHRHLEGFPDQLREAVAMGQETPLSVSGDGITSVVVAGMGGSAIGGELAAGYLARSMSVPLSVVRGYSLPAYVGPSTFVYVSSYSGNTEETLSAYAEARERRARIVCSTTGGEVGRVAEESGHDIVGVPTGYPPRAALGFGLVPLLFVLGRLGLAPDEEARIVAIRACSGGIRDRACYFGRCEPLVRAVLRELQARRAQKRIA
jgi:glucose/mannose-6-phosphate isomerase